MVQRDWKRKPRLTVTCTKEEPFTSRTPLIIQGNKGVWTGEGYYIRARVENTGKTRAEKVQVYASAFLPSMISDAPSL